MKNGNKICVPEKYTVYVKADNLLTSLTKGENLQSVLTDC